MTSCECSLAFLLTTLPFYKQLINTVEKKWIQCSRHATPKEISTQKRPKCNCAVTTHALHTHTPKALTKKSTLATNAQPQKPCANLASIPRMDQTIENNSLSRKYERNTIAAPHSAATSLTSLLLSHDNTKDLTLMSTADFCCLSRTTLFARPTVVCQSPVFHGRMDCRLPITGLSR